MLLPATEGSLSILRFLLVGLLTVDAMPFRFLGAGRFFEGGASVVGIAAGVEESAVSSMDAFVFVDRSRNENPDSFFAASMAASVSESKSSPTGELSFTTIVCAGVFSLGVPDGSSLM